MALLKSLIGVDLVVKEATTQRYIAKSYRSNGMMDILARGQHSGYIHPEMIGVSNRASWMTHVSKLVAFSSAEGMS